MTLKNELKFLKMLKEKSLDHALNSNSVELTNFFTGQAARLDVTIKELSAKNKPKKKRKRNDHS